MGGPNKTWLKANTLTLKCKKTKYIILGGPNKTLDNIDYKPKINNEKLEQVSVFKYLGIKLDANLTFNDHIIYILDKSIKEIATNGFKVV